MIVDASLVADRGNGSNPPVPDVAARRTGRQKRTVRFRPIVDFHQNEQSNCIVRSIAYGTNRRGPVVGVGTWGAYERGAFFIENPALRRGLGIACVVAGLLISGLVIALLILK